jgi:hypothetical protein
MRKEVIWAIIGGLVFGLVVTFGIVRVNSTMRPRGANTQASPTPEGSISEFKMALTKPENDDVVSTDTVNIQGITKALAWITISGEKGDYMLQSGEDGTFSQDVSLTSGVNQIKITAFDSAGSQSVEKLLVIYSSAFQNKTTDTSSPSTSTESSIRENVQKKVNEALNKPKAYLGTVTDITDSTIQIKSDEGTIAQVSVDPTTLSVVKSTGSAAAKNIKITDIAIGDYIVAMGYKNSNAVLDAQRILVTDPITDNKVNSYLGRITDVGKKINMQTIKDSQSISVTPGKNTSILLFKNGKTTTIKTSSLGTDMIVIFVMDESGASPTPRSIFAISQG